LLPTLERWRECCHIASIACDSCIPRDLRAAHFRRVTTRPAVLMNWTAGRLAKPRAVTPTTVTKTKSKGANGFLIVHASSQADVCRTLSQFVASEERSLNVRDFSKRPGARHEVPRCK